MNGDPSLQPVRSRQIRVFISSTFRDMQEERDILIKKIFPQLRKLCEERAVTWTEVDLRWGITDEQKAEGKVLPLCLEEIQRCRPYFIGLLGERYGWVPEPNSIPAELLDLQPWLKPHLQQSVTELEILHGVFSNESMQGHAYFYFREPKYSESVQDDKRLDFRVEGAVSAEKLGKLKQKIRSARDDQICELRENYSTPAQLGQWILEDFTKLIDRFYPKDKAPNSLDQEAARHESYARSRRLAFVGREDLLRLLNECAAESGRPLVLTGESGCGKSAFLAEWAARWRKDHPHDLIIQHYIGSTPESADWKGVVRRVLSELKRVFAIADEIPVQPDVLRVALNDWTMRATGAREVIIVIDGLNQLADNDGARQLVWLPDVFPINFRVFSSALPGESLEVLRKRDWRELNVPLFAGVDIAPAVLAYFKIFSKTLSQDIVATLESTLAARNPLYLRAVLDELRQLGRHEELRAKANHYLSAPDLPEIFDRILSRWEEDFGRDAECPGLVRRSLCLIASARYGLSETELLHLLGKDNEPMARHSWTPFYLAMENPLANRAGLLNFGHDYFRAAVCNRWLKSEESRREFHFQIMDFFSIRKEITKRKLDELPWQLHQLQYWADLNDLLADPVFFEKAWEDNADDVAHWWTEMESRSTFRLKDAYKPLLDKCRRFDPRLPQETGPGLPRTYFIPDLKDRDGFAACVSGLLHRAGYLPEAVMIDHGLSAYLHARNESLYPPGLRSNDTPIVRRLTKELYEEQMRDLEERKRMEGKPSRSPQEQKLIVSLFNKLDDAARRDRQQEERQRQQAICASMHSQAAGLRTLGDLEAAMHIFKAEERLSRTIDDNSGVLAALCGQAEVLRDQGQFEQAMVLYRDMEGNARTAGWHEALAKSLFGQGAILKEQGRLDEAMALFQESARLNRELGSKVDLADCLGGQAFILSDVGKYDEALTLIQEQKRLCKEAGHQGGLQQSCSIQAITLARLGHLDTAMAASKEDERLCRQSGDRASLQWALNTQGVILRQQGRWDDALNLHQEQEGICRGLKHNTGLYASLSNQAGIFLDSSRWEEALPILKKAEALGRETADNKNVLTTLNGQWTVLYQLGQIDELQSVVDRQVQVCRDLGDFPALADSLRRRAWVLLQMGLPDRAISTLEEEQELRGRSGDRGGLRVTIQNKASILRRLGKLDQALACHKEEATICRLLRDELALQQALDAQNEILSQLGSHKQDGSAG